MDKEHESKELEKKELKKVGGGYIFNDYKHFGKTFYGVFTDDNADDSLVYVGGSPSKEKARKMAISKGQTSKEIKDYNEYEKLRSTHYKRHEGLKKMPK